MFKKLIFLLIFAYQQIAFGLVTCSPSSCIPACNSSCTFSTCTQDSTHTFTVNQLPLSNDLEPANACAHTVQTSNDIPFTVNGIVKNSMPSSVVHSYTVCQAQVNIGTACAVTCSPGTVNNPPVACGAGFVGTKYTKTTTTCPSGIYSTPSVTTSNYDTSGCSVAAVTCIASTINNPAILCANGFGTRFTTTTTTCPAGAYGAPSVLTSGYDTSGCLPSGTVVGVITCDYTRPGCYCNCGITPGCSSTWHMAWGDCTGAVQVWVAQCGPVQPTTVNCLVP